MEQKQIIEIIKTKDNWESQELIKTIESQDKRQILIDFCYINGYECLRNGTQTKTCESLSDIQNLLNDYDIEFDREIEDPIKLAESIEGEWAERFNDGGGSGWIEF
jgi:hypothetical protein